MTNIDAKNLLVTVKSFARANPLPLDAYEIWESQSAAEAYIKSPIAYPGQTIKVLDKDGDYKTFIVQKDKDTGSLKMEEPKVTIDESKLTRYVQIVSELPIEGTHGVLYILTLDHSGYIWTGTTYKKVFNGNASFDTSAFARLDGADFIGRVRLAANPEEDLEAATKKYVDETAQSLLNKIEGFSEIVEEHSTSIEDLKSKIENFKLEHETILQESKAYTDEKLSWYTI